AKAAKTLPACTFLANTDFAGSAALSDIQLGWGLAQYHFAPHKPEKSADRKALLAIAKKDQDKAVDAQVRGIHIVREMINQPANKMTPQGIEAAAKKIAQTFSAKIKVTKGKVLESYAPAIHIVGRAAEIPPRLIDMSWGDKGPVITLVGKGISFDSRGTGYQTFQGDGNDEKGYGRGSPCSGACRCADGRKGQYPFARFGRGS
ncbi:MAG: hypothetical protein ACPGHX_03840, partial [Candidatus Puniceispirillaceae bacterium]